jgi:hypothetical protein
MLFCGVCGGLYMFVAMLSVSGDVLEYAKTFPELEAQGGMLCLCVIQVLFQVLQSINCDSPCLFCLFIVYLCCPEYPHPRQSLSETT